MGVGDAPGRGTALAWCWWRSRRSGCTASPRRWASTAAAGWRRGHDFPGEGEPGRDNDQLPVTGAHCERASVGVLKDALFHGRYRAVSVVLYVLMGWLVVVAAGPLHRALPAPGITLLLAGGLVYTTGIVFFALTIPISAVPVSMRASAVSLPPPNAPRLRMKFFIEPIEV